VPLEQEGGTLSYMWEHMSLDESGQPGGWDWEDVEGRIGRRGKGADEGRESRDAPRAWSLHWQDLIIFHKFPVPFVSYLRPS
jgi:hypothetical protein